MFQKGRLAVTVLSAFIAFYAVVGGLLGRVAAEDSTYRNLSLFTDVLNRVTQDYVEPPVLDKVMLGALRGLLEALDPYSGYLTRAQLESIEKKKQSAKADAGAVLSKRLHYAYVVAPVRGGPAEEAGLRPGDYVESIDGQSTYELNILEIQSLLKGAPGSSVELSLLRGQRSEPFTVSVKRQIPRLPEPQGMILDPRIGYLKVPFLAEGSAEQVRTRLKMLMSGSAEKILLDLRNSAGGELSEALKVANLFLSEGTLVTVQDREGKKTAFEADPTQVVCRMPLAVMVNEFTAGPSEIVAAALRDNDRAELVGRKTLGMGSRQAILPLKDGSALVLSVEKYLSPSGNPIQNESPKLAGVQPTLEVPQRNDRLELFFQAAQMDSREDTEAAYKRFIEQVEQKQLEAALRLLTEGSLKSRKAA
ncbi:MAG: S41 family peptidase [Acidobacteria bacterium]|nr:S41 family peptidase [Acidobacteriota bacterium]